MTEIVWSFQVWVASELKLVGTMSTFDLSFPAAYFDKLHLKYDSCKLVVQDSHSKTYIKEWRNPLLSILRCATSKFFYRQIQQTGVYLWHQMKGGNPMLNNRHSRAAHFIACELETATSIIVDVSTTEQDSHIFRVMQYLNHYFGKYWIVYPGNGTGIIRKQGK